MKLTYDITFDDFRSLFPPVASIRKPNPKLYVGIAFGAFLAAAGVLILLKALGIVTSRPVPIGTVGQGAATVVVGAAVVALCVAYERYSNGKLQKNYETTLLSRFKQQHCPKNRTVELTSEGIQTRCGCGTFNHPWNEISTFVGEGKFFRVKAGRDVIVLPQRIFSAADKDEFMSLIAKALNQTPLNSGLRVQFSYTRRDLRNARLLHVSKGMAWKEKLQLGGALLVFIGLIAAVPWLAARFPHAAMGIGLTVAFATLGVFRKVSNARKRAQGAFSASISWAGIQLRDASGVANERWQDYAGYVENRAYWLLYYKNKRYRIFPKRAFQPNQRMEFQQVISSNLQPRRVR